MNKITEQLKTIINLQKMQTVTYNQHRKNLLNFDESNNPRLGDTIIKEIEAIVTTEDAEIKASILKTAYALYMDTLDEALKSPNITGMRATEKQKLSQTLEKLYAYQGIAQQEIAELSRAIQEQKTRLNKYMLTCQAIDALTKEYARLMLLIESLSGKCERLSKSSFNQFKWSLFFAVTALLMTGLLLSGWTVIAPPLVYCILADTLLSVGAFVLAVYVKYNQYQFAAQMQEPNQQLEENKQLLRKCHFDPDSVVPGMGKVNDSQLSITEDIEKLEKKLVMINHRIKKFQERVIDDQSNSHKISYFFNKTQQDDTNTYTKTTTNPLQHNCHLHRYKLRTGV